MSDSKVSNAYLSLTSESFDLAIFDFKNHLFNGDARLAFQFVPFLQNLFDNEGISYILDTLYVPHRIVPIGLLRIAEEEQIVYDQAVAAFDLDSVHWNQDSYFSSSTS